VVSVKLASPSLASQEIDSSYILIWKFPDQNGEKKVSVLKIML
jgi:hypothetical protein